jgi:hypothetical protein
VASLVAPTPFAQFSTRGRSYAADASGSITVTSPTDIQDLISAGCVYAGQVGQAGGGGTTPTNVTATGSTQAAAAVLSGAMTIINGGGTGTGVAVANLPNQQQVIYNSTASPKTIWPLNGMAFLPQAVNASVTLQAGQAFGIVVIDSSSAVIVSNTSSFG